MPLYRRRVGLERSRHWLRCKPCPPASRAEWSFKWWAWIAAVALGLGGGFWLGYATLARRVRRKFGGIKVY